MFSIVPATTYGALAYTTAAHNTAMVCCNFEGDHIDSYRIDRCEVTLARPRGASKWRKWVAEMVSVIPVALPDEGVSDVVDRFLTDNHATS